LTGLDAIPKFYVYHKPEVRKEEVKVEAPPDIIQPQPQPEAAPAPEEAKSH
jgi:hypothetical protein